MKSLRVNRKLTLVYSKPPRKPTLLGRLTAVGTGIIRAMGFEGNKLVVHTVRPRPEYLRPYRSH